MAHETIIQPGYRCTCQICGIQIRSSRVSSACDHCQQNARLVGERGLGRAEDGPVSGILRLSQVIVRAQHHRLRNVETDQRDQHRECDGDEYWPDDCDLAE